MNEEEQTFMRLSEAAGYVEEKTGERPVAQTLHRWVDRGLAGVKLKTVYVGGIRRVSRAMLREFVEAVTAAKTRATVATPDTAPAQGSSHAARERAEKELRDAGM